MDVIKKIFEKIFYKKRNIYSMEESLQKKYVNEKDDIQHFIICTFEDLQSDLQFNNIKRIGSFSRDKTINRLKSQNFILFILVHPDNRQIVASYWAYIPQKHSSWYDTLQINQREAILCNAYVEQSFRSQGFYTHLVKYCHDYLFNKQDILRVFTIVEQSNKASDAVNSSFYGHVHFENTLIKFFSFNLFSILSNADVRRVYFVPTGHCIYES